MKNLLIILFIGLVSIPTKAQSNLPKAIKDINTDVERINKELGEPFKEIDNLSKRPITYNIWVKDNRIQKIKTHQPLPSAFTTTEYYFKYDRLIYVANISSNLTGDSTIAFGYFNYDELISQDHLIYEGEDTLFWGATMQREGYTLFDKYRKYLNYNPYKTIEYDSVVAYDFRGEGGGSITNGKGRLDKTAKNGTMLSEQQIDSLIETITDTTTYGGFSAACFDPHMGIVFYKNGKAMSTIDICFECNYLVSSEILHATSYHLMRDFREDYMVNSPRYGFTPLGRKKLRTLCSQLGLELCPKEESIWDKETED
jgi:hypothetical protein